MPLTTDIKHLFTLFVTKSCVKSTPEPNKLKTYKGANNTAEINKKNIYIYDKHLYQR